MARVQVVEETRLQHTTVAHYCKTNHSQLVSVESNKNTGPRLLLLLPCVLLLVVVAVNNLERRPKNKRTSMRYPQSVASGIQYNTRWKTAAASAASLIQCEIILLLRATTIGNITNLVVSASRTRRPAARCTRLTTSNSQTSSSRSPYNMIRTSLVKSARPRPR